MKYFLIMMLLVTAVSCGSSDPSVWNRMDDKQSKRGGFKASDTDDARIVTSDSDGVPTIVPKPDASQAEAKEKNSKSSDDPVDDPENVPTLPPAAVAGAFLSDCYWSSTDNAIFCRMGERDGKEKIVAKPVEVENILSLKLFKKSSGKENDEKEDLQPAFTLERNSQHFVKIDWSPELKGNQGFAKFDVMVANKDLNFKDVLIGNIPPLRADFGNPVGEEPPLSMSQRIDAIKLGDDGLGEDVECPQIEAEAQAKGNVARALSWSVEVQLDNPVFALEIKETCGNTGPEGSGIPLGRFEIWDDKDQLQFADVIPSRPPGEIPANAPALVFKKQFPSLKKGTYRVMIVPGPSPTHPGRLNDFVIKQARIFGIGMSPKRPVMMK